MEKRKRLSNSQLKNKSNKIRKDVVDIAIKNGAGHIAPSLSCVDILTALYYRVMDFGKSPDWEGRDRLIFSKGHGCYGLYAILVDIGYINRGEWESFYEGSHLSGCLERSIKDGIEAGCGSLGHGLPMAVGVAFGAKIQGYGHNVYCIVGDGEFQEGTNWEAIQFAVKHELSNLTIIVDNNRLQAMDFLKNILTVEGRDDDLKIKLEAFGVDVVECDGHQTEAIISAIKEKEKRPDNVALPQAVIANTIKGYGLLCMENIPKYHFRIPTEGELKMGKRYEQ